MATKPLLPSDTNSNHTRPRAARKRCPVERPRHVTVISGSLPRKGAIWLFYAFMDNTNTNTNTKDL